MKQFGSHVKLTMKDIAVILIAMTLKEATPG